MSFAATNSTSEPRAISLGPIRMQVMSFTAAATDAAGTFTADKFTTITDVVVTGAQLTAAPTISGNSVTLAFTAAPAGGLAGSILIFGR